MNILPFIHIFAFSVYLWLLIFVIYKNPRSKLNRVCGLFILTMAIWNFGAAFIQSANLKSQIPFWDNISSIGWINFPSLLLWLTLIITEKEKILKKWYFYFFIFLIPAILLYKQWSGFLIVGAVRRPFGWGAVWSDSIWPDIFNAFYVIFMLGSIYLLHIYGKKAEETYKKKQVAIISSTFILIFIIGSLTDVVLPQILKIYLFPPMGCLLGLIWVVGLVYAITKYGFMSITPATASRDIISSMGEALILIDMEKTIVAFNRAAEKLLGYDEGEIKGKKASILFSPENSSILERIYEAKTVRIDKLWLIKKSSDKVPVAFTASLVKSSEGMALGAVMVAHDISDIIKKNRELEKSYRTQARMKEELIKEESKREQSEMKKKLNRSEKLAMIGRLAGSVGHEIRTPLSSIKNSAFFLEKYGNFSDEESEKYIDVLKNEIKRVEDIITSLLDFSRSGKLKISKIDIAKKMDDVMEKIKLAGGVKVEKNISSEASQAEANEFKFERLLENLISNAADAVGEEGVVEIKTEKNSSGKYLRVRDSGKGMEEEELENIFEPLYTTKEKGVGLGTAIIKDIVDSHNWDIEVKSEKGKGSEFIIKFK